MSHKVISPVVGALMCEKCRVVYAHHSAHDPITINGERYEFLNPLSVCTSCGGKLSNKYGDDYAAEIYKYRYKRENHGY